MQYSALMRVAGILGLKKVRWALRRLHCPVSRDALVLEVGAGGNPYPRSNVLLDGFENSLERVESEIVRDRPVVLGLCESLPFRDKSFDFVIASHVLEHSDQPERFLSELMRVGKAGYIETPDAFFERINPYTYHRLEVTDREGKLVIRKKKNWKPEEELALLYAAKLARDKDFARFLRISPDSFYTRFYWKGKIDYVVLNPSADASWDYPPEARVNCEPGSSWKSRLRSAYLNMIRKMTSQNRRNKRINLFDLLKCPICNHENFDVSRDKCICTRCGEKYPIEAGVPRMFPRNIDGANKFRVSGV